MAIDPYLPDLEAKPQTYQLMIELTAPVRVPLGSDALWRLLSWRSSCEHIMGESVSATKPETRTAPDRARANSMNRRPVRPVAKASGA